MDEDFFDDDDGLDDLPPNTLQDLENRARLSTQHAPQIAGAANAKSTSSDYGLGDDEEVIDLDAHPERNVLTARQSSQRPLSNALSQAPPSQARPQDEVTQREQWRLQRYGARPPNRLPAFRPPRPTLTNGRSSQAPSEQSTHANGEPSASQAPPSLAVNEAQHLDVATLQARIAELERTNATLAKETQDAHAAAHSRAGEIAIVRANQERSAKEYEQKLSVLQQQHAQEAARHKTDMEAARKAREKMETNNKFLEHDLAQETDRARNAQRSGKEGKLKSQRGRTVASPATTPKKASLPFRDGFNDDEVVAVSPSKSKDQSKPSTPRAASKRKRSETENSPANQLSFSEQDAPASGTGKGTPAGSVNADIVVRTRDKAPDERVDLIQFVLDHRLEDGRRTIEALTNLWFPSSREVPISSHIYDALKPAKDLEETKELEVSFCTSLLNLWLRCLQEELYIAIPIMLSLTNDVLIELGDKVCPSIASKVIPPAVQTADLVATPKARAWANPAMNKGPPPEIEALVDPLRCIQILHLVTIHCYDMPDVLRGFWSCMEHDFVLVMLHRAQPISQSMEILDLLPSSILSESFGAINTRPSESTAELSVQQRQNQNEYNLVSRLANLLVDRRDQRFRPEKVVDTYAMSDSSDDESLDEADTLDNDSLPTAIDLRLGALGLLTSLCTTEHGAKLLASHRVATGRLIRLLHESLISLYDYNPRTHISTTACINQSVMLLAHLCFEHGEALDLRTKLAAESGGHHKHLLSLSRVAFSTGETVLEEGIWSEAAEVAHKMLDDFLSPEEGEAVMGVFSSGRPAVG